MTTFARPRDQKGRFIGIGRETKAEIILTQREKDEQKELTERAKEIETKYEEIAKYDKYTRNSVLTLTVWVLLVLLALYLNNVI